jgi:hypothetical protein
MNSPAAKPRRYVCAFICQHTMRERDNLLTAIRLVEGFTTSPIGQLATGQVMYFPINASAVIIFRSDEPCESVLTIKVIDPSGRELEGTSTFTVRSKSLVEGHSLNVNFKIPGDKEGDYVFEVYLDGEIATKVPLRITHQKQVPPHGLDQPPETSQGLPGSPRFRQ